jgi:hypothetical protein
LVSEDLGTLTIEDTPPQPIIQTLESTDSKEDLYWESDDINPNQIIYDLENDQVIIPNSDEELNITPLPTPGDFIKVVSRNVGNTRRRSFR